MADLNITVQLVGTSFVFNDTNTDNIDDVLDDLGATPCDFTVEYNSVTYEGTALKVNDEIVATFDDAVALPSGMCMSFDCSSDSGTGSTRDCRDVEIPFHTALKMAVLDNNGCLRGWILMSDIIANIINTDPQTLCESLNIDSVPEGNLVAGDRVLTINDPCSLKSVPMSDIVCD